MKRRFGRLASAFLGLWLQACGGAAVQAEPPPSAAPAPAPQRPLTDLDALQHDFDVSEQQLTAQLERRQAEVASGPALGRGEAGREKKAEEGADKDRAAAGSANRPSPPPAPAEQKPAASTPDADYSPIGAPCDLMCRALSSMQRSANGICGIAGESDSRCASARLRVQLATEKVKQAGCACTG